MMSADGSGSPELIRDSAGREELAESWAANGMLAFSRIENANRDIWVVNVDGERKARPFVATRFGEFEPRFSPDGGWVAYVSNESGQAEVYVRPYPGPGPARRISSDGGREPRWRRDGRELFYRASDRMMVVDVLKESAASFSAPHVLFKAPFESTSVYDPWGSWDVMPDGQSFVMVQLLSKPRHTVSLVQNWFKEFERR
jgi:dipeptidyl aminopeptidase/acylaminoacyl peptidase